MSKVKADVFFQHHKQLLQIWSKSESLNMDAVVIKNGKDQSGNKIKTSALSMWYFGFDFIDTIMLITRKSFSMIGGTKKIQMLKTVEEHPEAKEFDIKTIEKDPTNNSTQIKQLFDILEAEFPKKPIKIGTLLKEQQIGPFMAEYDTFIKDKEGVYNFIDCGTFIQDCLAIKDQTEISNISKAAKLSVFLQSRCIKEIETIIEEEGKKTHSSISSKIEELIENDKELKKIASEIGDDNQNIDLAYSPIIQSGGKYDLKPNAQSNDDLLSYDTIIVSVGTKYMEYHANIVRTLFIDPTTDQKKIYQKVYELQNQLAAQLKPGTKLKTVYENAVAFIKEKVPQLQEKIPSNFGFGIGLEFRESNLYINAKNEKEVEEGMVFNVVVGFDNLLNEKEKPYAIQVSDTVAVRKQNQPNAAMTYKVSRKYEDISYSIQDENPDEEEAEEDDLEKENIIQDGRRTRNAYHKNTTIVSEKERQKHQLDLRKTKLQELQERLSTNGFSSAKVNQRTLDLDRISCYRALDDIPREYTRQQIHVDAKNNAILLPINGDLVPFHISLIKNYSKNDEGKTHTLRLNFHNPGSLSNVANISFPKVDGQVVYVKELTFRSKNARNMVETMRKIKELQAKLKQSEVEAKNKDDFVEQEKLQLRNTKRPALRNLKVRPAISKQKVSGMLELHLNGFRYMTTKNEKIDVIFKNIKHSIFQPCDNEMIVAIHFNLINPIIIGKKKVYDVQFYTEAGLPPEDLNNRRRGQDLDEIEEEQMEKARRKKLNKDFEAFYKEVELQLNERVKFEVPYSTLGFYGSPIRSTCLLQPTQNTLMNIIESPFFIMSLEEVELACFERMIGGLRNFDLVFIFKDYEKQVTRIASIPIDKAEVVKNWLNTQNILYFESTKSFQWSNILKTIRQDISSFVQDGGWDIILGDSDDEGEESDIGDESFSVDEEDDEVESESISEDSDDSFEEDEEDDSEDFDGDDDLSEEGKDWSDLEESTRREEEKKKVNQKVNQKPPPKRR